MKRRNLGIALTGATAVFALGACSSSYPGDAAVVGDVRIPQSEIAEQVRSLNEAVGNPADTPNAEVTRTLVSYNVGYELIRQTAAELQVAVAPAQLDEIFAQQVAQVGGEEQLIVAAAQQGVAPVNLRRDLETQLLARAIVEKVSPGGDPNVGQTILTDAVREVAQSVGVEVAPKYGYWDNEQLQITPDPDPVARPAEEAAPALPTP